MRKKAFTLKLREENAVMQKQRFKWQIDDPNQHKRVWSWVVTSLRDREFSWED